MRLFHHLLSFINPHASPDRVHSDLQISGQKQWTQLGQVGAPDRVFSVTQPMMPVQHAMHPSSATQPTQPVILNNLSCHRMSQLRFSHESSCKETYRGPNKVRLNTSFNIPGNTLKGPLHRPSRKALRKERKMGGT